MSRPLDLGPIEARVAAAPTFAQLFDLRARILTKGARRDGDYTVSSADLERLFALAHAPLDLAVLLTEVKRLRATLSALPRTCQRCGAGGRWEGSLDTHPSCGGKLA